jgi:hypothetical protein
MKQKMKERMKGNKKTHKNFETYIKEQIFTLTFKRGLRMP